MVSWVWAFSIWYLGFRLQGRVRAISMKLTHTHTHTHTHTTETFSLQLPPDWSWKTDRCSMPAGQVWNQCPQSSQDFGGTLGNSRARAAISILVAVFAVSNAALPLLRSGLFRRTPRIAPLPNGRWSVSSTIRFLDIFAVVSLSLLRMNHPGLVLLGLYIEREPPCGPLHVTMKPL